jgi:hypothetical protein
VVSEIYLQAPTAFICKNIMFADLCSIFTDRTIVWSVSFTCNLLQPLISICILLMITVDRFGTLDVNSSSYRMSQSNGP